MLDNNFGDELFISNLQKALVKICTDRQLLNKQLYNIEELMEKFDEVIKAVGRVGYVGDINSVKMIESARAVATDLEVGEAVL